MSDPLRTGDSRALDAASDADRDAKIEQLLLVGLDHYFAARYELAINVWSRALFLDRSHARAGPAGPHPPRRGSARGGRGR